MASWQLLRAGKANQAALGYWTHHGAGGLVHYSAAPAAAGGPDDIRSFCLSREKVSMQQLNSRLAVYLQQVQSLEAANQKLEFQIQKELNRKCPRELRELDGHLKKVSLLQDQIRDCLSAQAEVKLHLLKAELTIFDLNFRWAKERECRGCLEAELIALRQLEEELHVHRLPELQCRLNNQTEELMGMQMQHQQDMQGLLAQMSGGVTVAMQPVKMFDLKQQLDDLRRTNVTLLEENRNECWINGQISVLSSPEVTFDPPELEVIHAELLELRRTAASLEEELTRLQNETLLLGACGQESIVQQLEVLHQTADSLCLELDSVLQAAAQQAVDHQTLLDTKSRLEAEIQDYRRLLDGLSPQGPSVFRRNITVNKSVTVQGANLRAMEVQGVSKGHIRTVGQTTPLSETKTTVKSVSKHPKTSPATSINTSNLTGSFVKSEIQKSTVLPERTGRESVTISRTINRQSSPSVLSSQFRQNLDKEAAVKASKPETNAAQRFTRSAAVQEKTEPFISKQTTTEVKKTERNIQPVTQTTTTDPSKQTAADVKKESERAVISAQKSQDIAEVASVSAKIGTESVQDAAKVVVTASCVPGSQVLGSEEAQDKVSGDLTVMDDKKIEKQENKVKEEGTLPVLRLDQSPAKLEPFVSKQTPRRAGFEADKTNIQTVITKTNHCAESEVNQRQQTTAEIKKDTETVISAQKKQDTAEVVSLSVKAPTEAGRDAVDVAVTASFVSGDLTTSNNENIEGQEKKGGEEEVRVKGSSGILTLSDSTKKYADTWSGNANVSPSSPDRNGNHDSKTAQGITTLLADTQSDRSDAVEAKQKTFSSKQTSTANNTETNIQTGITRIIVCKEPEAKQERQSAAGTKEETETEGSVRALKTPSESVQDAADVAGTASCVSGSQVLWSEEAQGKVSSDLKDDKDIERKEKKEQEEEVEGGTSVHRLDLSSELPCSNTEPNRVVEAADAGSESNAQGQGITTLLTDTQSDRSDAVEAKPETLTSKQITTEADLEADKTETNIQAEITRTAVCEEPEVKQGRQTAGGVKKETETETTQINSSERSIQGKNNDPEEIMPVSLDPSKSVQDAADVAVTEFCVSGSQVLGSEEAQGKVSGNFVKRDNERQEKKREEEVVKGVKGTLLDKSSGQSTAVSNSSNTKQDKVVDDADAGLDSNDNLESRTVQGITSLMTDAAEAKPKPLTSNQTSTEVGLQLNKTEIRTIFGTEPEVKQDPHKTTTDQSKQTVADVNKETETVICTEGSIKDMKTPAESVQDAAEVADTASCVPGCQVVGSEEAQGKVTGDLTLKKEKDIKRQEKRREEEEVQEIKGTLHVDSSDQSPELSDPPNSKQDKVLKDASHSSRDSNENLESKPASTEIMKQVELEVNQGKVVNSFHDTDEEKVDPSESDKEVVTKPVEVKVLVSVTEQVTPDSLPVEEAEEEEEEEEDSLSITEANVQVRPVEKYILSTKEERQSWRMSREEDRNGKVNISKPISQGIGFLLSGGLGSLEFGGSNECSIIADKKEQQQSFEGQYKSTCQDKKDRSPNQQQASSANGEVRGQTTQISGVASDSGGVATSDGGMASIQAASSGRTAANPSGTVGGNAEAATAVGTQGKFRCNSGEGMVYGGSLGQTSMRLPNTGSKENPSGPMQQETGRFSSWRIGEWMVYGGSLGRKSSLDGGASSLPCEGKEEGPATSRQERGRFGSSGSREWIVYSGSFGLKNRLSRTRSEESRSPPAMLPTTSQVEIRKFGSGELSGNLSTATHQNTSLAGSRKFNSRGSGEWKVYGGSTGCISSSSLSETGREESLSVVAQLPTSPPGSQGAGRFGSGGSGEWRVYGGSCERLSRASSASRVSVSANKRQMFSPPGSHTGTGARLSSAGSGGKRSSSVGSGGRLSSSSGSHRVSTSGRFTSTSSGEWKPVYSSANARKSGSGSSGRSGGGGGSQRVSNPSGVSLVSSGRVSSSTAGGNFVSSSAGSGSKLSSAGGSNRASGQTGRISSSSGSGRTSSTGGRVISSSDRPIRSTGSGAGGNKERISVCKMAALSISAAGRERSQDKQRQAQRQAAASSSLLQRWLTTGVEVKGAEPDGHDDIMRL